MVQIFGRFPLQISPNFGNSNLGHVEITREVEDHYVAVPWYLHPAHFSLQDGSAPPRPATARKSRRTSCGISGVGQPAWVGNKTRPPLLPMSRSSAGVEGPGMLQLKRPSTTYSRIQKVGIWAWDDLGWMSFFSRLWGWRTVTFKNCLASTVLPSLHWLLNHNASRARNNIYYILYIYICIYMLPPTPTKIYQISTWGTHQAALQRIQ